MKTRRFGTIFLAIIIVIASTGLTFAPAKASGCAYYHIVSYGETLSWIGRYYGLNWKNLAAVNNLRYPYKIYAGQRLCLSGGGYGGIYVPPSKGWSYSVVNVVRDVSVTIRTSNFPDNVLFEAFVGQKQGAAINWKKVSDLDSGRGGRFKADFNIPVEFAGASQLYIRLTQPKKNLSVDRWFNNSSYTSGTGGPYYPWYYYGTIPTIWITGVVRNSTVTIRTNNFPAGLDFQVLMGPMGTRGVGGYYVTTFNSGAGGTMVLTFNIPPELYGSNRIAIRTQNNWSGFHSYNWFYNNTTN